MIDMTLAKAMLSGVNATLRVKKKRCPDIFS